MKRLTVLALLALFAPPWAIVACSAPDGAATDRDFADRSMVTVASANGRHLFHVEVARTPDAQARGLMFRTDIADDGGMLFAPYPAEGSGPREASFWMKNTPSSLDIIFIRSDGSIARIAENTIPFSDAPIVSGEPVVAVLEIRGGRAAELGIAENDRVSWKP